MLKIRRHFSQYNKIFNQAEHISTKMKPVTKSQSTSSRNQQTRKKPINIDDSHVTAKQQFSHLSLTYIDNCEDQQNKIYEEQFQFECKKILHLWMAEILPGASYLHLKYDMPNRKIKGVRSNCIQKLSECRIFLQERKMKLISDTILDHNKKLYLQERLDIRIFERPFIEAASNDLINNKGLYQLKKDIANILAKKYVYLISIFKRDQKEFNQLFQYVDSREITRSDIKLAKGQGSKCEETQLNKKKNIYKNSRKKYLQKSQQQQKVIIRRPNDNEDSSSGDNSTINIKWDDIKENSQNEDNIKQQQTVSKQQKQKSEIIFKKQFPANVFSFEAFQKWINNQKNLLISQFTFKKNNFKDVIQIQFVTKEKKEKKLNIINFYFNFSKYLLLKQKYEKILEFFKGQMSQIANKRCVQCKLFEGYVEQNTKQYEIIELFKQKKVSNVPQKKRKKKVVIIILNGIKSNVEQTSKDMQRFLQQNQKDINIKQHLQIAILQIKDYKKQKKLQDTIKQILAQTLEKICSEADFQATVIEVKCNGDKLVALLQISKNFYHKFLNQYKQKILTSLKESIHVEQQIMHEQDLSEDLVKKYLLFKSKQHTNKVTLITTKKNLVKTTKQIMQSQNKIQTWTQMIKNSRLPLIESLLKQSQKEDTGVKMTIERYQQGQIKNSQKADMSYSKICLVGNKKNLSKVLNHLKQKLRVLNNQMLEKHVFLTESESKVIQKKIKQFKQVVHRNYQTNLTFNQNKIIDTFVSLSPNNLEPKIDDPFLIFIMKYQKNINLETNMTSNLQYLPTFTTITLISDAELELLNQEAFQSEKTYLKSRRYGFVENLAKNIKFVFEDKFQSIDRTLELTFKFCYNIQGQQEMYLNLAFFIPKQKKHQYVILLLKKIYQKRKNKKTRIFLFDYNSKDICKQLEPLQQFQKDYLSKPKLDYYIKDGLNKYFYSESGNQKIEEAIKNSQDILYLSNSDINMVDLSPTHICSFKQQKLIHISTNKQINLLIYPQKICFNVDGVQFEMPSEQIKKVQKEKTNEWVKICLSIYEINLLDNFQRNIFTGYRRTLSKKQIPPENPFGKWYFNISQNYKVNDVEITHFPNEEQKAMNSIKLLKELIEAEKTTIIHKFKYKISEQKIRKLKQFSRDYQAQIIWDGNQSIKISGFEKFAIELLVKNIDMLIAQSKQIIYPKYWSQQKQDIQVFPVSKGSMQFNEVQILFKITTIKQLLRIQNKLVYKKFYDERQSLMQLNGGKPVKEMRLFHGTKQLDPAMIYEDKQESFNVNYTGDNNYLGRGTYFAQQAKYSVNYQHRQLLQTGQIQKSMLLCSVLVGDSQKFDKVSEETKALRDTRYKDPLKKLRYQSNTMYTNHSNIYAVYKNRRAYPEYLIKY